MFGRRETSKAGRTPENEAENASKERFLAAQAWCERNLPDEDARLAASAALTLRLNGRWPSPALVRNRLRSRVR